MDKQNVQGKKDRVEGTIKEKAGELTGDKSLETKGKIQDATGKVREGVGHMREDADRQDEVDRTEA